MVSMNEALHAFESHLVMERMVSEHTVAAYKRDCLQFIHFLNTQSIHMLSHVNRLFVKDFLVFLKKELDISAKSASRKLSTLKSFSKFCMQSFSCSDFTQGVAFPKLGVQLPAFISIEEIKKLFHVSKKDISPVGKRNTLILFFLYVCGIRVSELTNLRISNISFDESLITVFGKGSKERIIPLTDEIMQFLQLYLSDVRPKLLEGFSLPEDYLFCVSYGTVLKPLSRQTIWGVIKQLANKAKLKKFLSPHVLRHTLASHLLKKGMNLRLLQSLLGHERLETVQVYTHLEKSHLRMLYDKMHIRA